MQTNLSVQTSIWAIGSTSRGGAQGVGGGICKNVITQSKGGRLIVKLSNPPCLLDVNPVDQIEVCTVCMKRSWFAPDMIPRYKYIFMINLFGDISTNSIAINLVKL